MEATELVHVSMRYILRRDSWCHFKLIVNLSTIDRKSNQRTQFFLAICVKRSYLKSKDYRKCSVKNIHFPTQRTTSTWRRFKWICTNPISSCNIWLDSSYTNNFTPRSCLSWPSEFISVVFILCDIGFSSSDETHIICPGVTSSCATDMDCIRPKPFSRPS